MKQDGLRGFYASVLIAGGWLALGCGLARGGQSFDDGNDGLGEGRVASPEPALRIQRSTALFTSETEIDASSGLVGDLDADGLAELVLVAGVPDEPRRAFGFYGRALWPGVLELGESDFIIYDVDGGLTRTGDINGDGYDDFGLVAQNEVGTCCRFDLVLGSAQRLPRELSSRTLETSIGAGPPGSSFERMKVSAAGDVNGDGRADLVAAGERTAALILGRSEAFGQTTVTAHVAALFPIPGFERGAFTIPIGPEPAGDLDGDGLMDVLIPGAPEAGTALYYGRAEGFAGSSEPLPADALLWGIFPRRLGDWDGDGKDDLVQIQRWPYGSEGDELGLKHELQPVYGGSARFQGDVDLSGDGGAFVPRLEQLAIGDVNADSLPDLLVGTSDSPDPLNPEDTGALYVLRGTGQRMPAVLALGAADAALRERVAGVASGADVDGDGIEDLLLVRLNEGRASALLVFGDAQL